MGYIVTGSGSAYLDEVLGEETTNKQELRTRILGSLERSPGISFGELMGHVEEQRGQIERGELGWAPRGSQNTYRRTLDEMVEEGLVEDV